MARRFTGGRLVIATHQPGKLKEIAELLAPFAVDGLGARELGLPEPDETSQSFQGNAELKALAAARGANLPALADDSGLAVDALGGAPGVYSARWAGPKKDFAMAMQRVERQLGHDADRKAHFVSALSLAWPDGHVESFEGQVQGRLVWPPRGDRGFGYDPMFLPDGRSQTFGEMDPKGKNQISHRAEAFRRLVDACFAT